MLVVLARLLVIAPRWTSRRPGTRRPRLLGRPLVAPEVEVAVRRVRRRARGLEPRVLVGRVVHDEVRDHADAAVAAGAHHLREVAERPERRIDAEEVRDVVAVVAVGRGIERHQPQAADAQPGQVVDPLGQPDQIAAAVAVGVEERLDVEAVEDRVLPPQVAGGLDRHRRSPGRTCSPKRGVDLLDRVAGRRRRRVPRTPQPASSAVRRCRLAHVLGRTSVAPRRAPGVSRSRSVAQTSAHRSCASDVRATAACTAAPPAPSRPTAAERLERALLVECRSELERAGRRPSRPARAPASARAARSPLSAPTAAAGSGVGRPQLARST